jgi:hypothetical protein
MSQLVNVPREKVSESRMLTVQRPRAKLFSTLVSSAKSPKKIRNSIWAQPNMKAAMIRRMGVTLGRSKPPFSSQSPKATTALWQDSGVFKLTWSGISTYSRGRAPGLADG